MPATHSLIPYTCHSQTVQRWRSAKTGVLASTCHTSRLQIPGPVFDRSRSPRVLRCDIVTTTRQMTSARHFDIEMSQTADAQCAHLRRRAQEEKTTFTFSNSIPRMEVMTIYKLVYWLSSSPDRFWESLGSSAPRKNLYCRPRNSRPFSTSFMLGIDNRKNGTKSKLTSQCEQIGKRGRILVPTNLP